MEESQTGRGCSRPRLGVTGSRALEATLNKKKLDPFDLNSAILFFCTLVDENESLKAKFLMYRESRRKEEVVRTEENLKRYKRQYKYKEKKRRLKDGDGAEKCTSDDDEQPI
mmetsp:Transcript_34754/g.55717  ORF Transcript_34754/g.55717 Transcript_34754/m.55717 type:complete len:112 (-) Transcript_34754:1152-1487(-)